MKKSLLFVWCFAIVCLMGCSATVEEVEATPTSAPTATIAPTPTPTPEPEVYQGSLNPLTGLPITEGHETWRPVAVVLNNLYSAMPQLGQSEADIIYEMPVEGGITRMVALYQDTTDVGTIGSIRSSRPYMLELALAHDAIYIHAGGSTEAYEKASLWDVTALDGVNGPYMSNTEGEKLMWRDPTRMLTYSLEHTTVTTGETIISELEEYNLRRNVEDDFAYDMTFAEDPQLEDGQVAQEIAVVYSTYKTGRFTYDPQEQVYQVSQYSAPYVDGNDGSQVTVANVVIVQAVCTATNDSLDHINIELSGTGEGYYAWGGQYIPITWSKTYPDGQFYYYDLEGNPITFGQGSTYVNIVSTSTEITFE